MLMVYEILALSIVYVNLEIKLGKYENGTALCPWANKKQIISLTQGRSLIKDMTHCHIGVMGYAKMWCHTIQKCYIVFY